MISPWGKTTFRSTLAPSGSGLGGIGRRANHYLRRSRMRWSDCRSWHSSLFTGTKCIVGRPARLDDRLRVRRVVLGSAHERSDEVGGDQAHHPPGLLKHAPPMMSAAAGLHS